MKITLKKDIFIDNARGVQNAGTCLDIEEQRARQLITAGYAAEGGQSADDAKPTPAKRKANTTAKKALDAAPENKQTQQPMQPDADAPAAQDGDSVGDDAGNLPNA